MGALKLLQRVFSRLRVIDLVGVGVLLSAFFILAFFLLRKGAYVNVVLRASDGDVFFADWYSSSNLWYMDSLQVGISQFDFWGNNIIEIIDKKVYPTGQTRRIVDITLRIKAVYNKRTKQYAYQGNPLLIGATQKFELNTIVVRGLIRDINNTAHYPAKRYNIKGFLHPLYNNPTYGWGGSFTGTPNTTGIPIYLANKINKGNAVYDSRGNAIANVTSVKKIPAVFVLAEALAYRIPDEKMVEVLVEAGVEAETIGGKPMYLGIQPILVGSNVTLYFDTHTITLMITDFNIADQTDNIDK